MAEEQGACLWSNETKYSKGLTPNQTYKQDVDELVPHKERMPWRELRDQLKTNGIRNSTLMALMPAETSAQISNATNGIEPPRSLVSVKQSKHGVLKQVVPSIHKLKNKYELLWDQRSPEGYLQIMAVLQKYIDQGISVNTSYNPENFDDNKVPMSEMIKDLVTAYKYGIKQLYYFNTHDGAGEIKVEYHSREELPSAVDDAANVMSGYEEEDCEACVI